MRLGADRRVAVVASRVRDRRHLAKDAVIEGRVDRASVGGVVERVVERPDDALVDHLAQLQVPGPAGRERLLVAGSDRAPVRIDRLLLIAIDPLGVVRIAPGGERGDDDDPDPGDRRPVVAIPLADSAQAAFHEKNPGSGSG